jgi:hypothetical protein
MRKVAYIFQFDSFWSVIGGGSVAPYLAGQGFNGVSFKVLDGQTFEGHWDHSSSGINSLADITSWAQDFRSHGLDVDVWVNVHKDNLEAQVSLWQQILTVADVKRFTLDLEPYADFWGDESDCSALVPTIKDLNLSITYDPRRLAWPGIGACLDVALYQMPQIYDPSWIGPAIASEQGHPHAVMEPLVPAWTGPDVWQAILANGQLGSTRGRSGYGVFSVPLTNAALVSALQAME